MAQDVKYTLEGCNLLTHNCATQKRYQIDDSKQPPRIRANQGHSFDAKDLELQPVTDASQVLFAVHVTGRQG